jgi:predicted nucleotidyltransferase
MSGIPVTKVRRHFLPEDRLKDLLKEDELDSLEEKLLSLVELLAERSGVRKREFGVTGSILLDIHQVEFSDIDLLIYGRKNSLRLKESLLSIYADSSLEIRKFSGKDLEEWCESKVGIYPMTYEEAALLYRRRWNRGFYQSTMFSIHPVLIESEQLESYGDRWFRSLGSIIIEAEVLSNSESMFLPSKYEIGDVQILKGLKVDDLREVCSYQGIYSDLLTVGERMLAKGKLEYVEDKRSGEKYHRLLIGGPEAQGRDYIKPIK